MERAKQKRGIDANAWSQQVHADNDRRIDQIFKGNADPSLNRALKTLTVGRSGVSSSLRKKNDLVPEGQPSRARR